MIKLTLQTSFVFLMLPIVTAYAASEEAYGQYVCQVDSSVGITMNEKGQIYSGPITLPSSERTFGLTIRPVVLDVTLPSFCKQSLDYWSERIRKGEPFKDYDAPSYPKAIQPRRSLAYICLAKDKAIVSNQKENGESSQSELRSYENAFEFEGVTVGHWLQIFTNKTFRLSFPYDSGTVMSAGKCIRVPSSK